MLLLLLLLLLLPFGSSTAVCIVGAMAPEAAPRAAPKAAPKAALEAFPRPLEVCSLCGLRKPTADRSKTGEGQDRRGSKTGEGARRETEQDGRRSKTY